MQINICLLDQNSIKVNARYQLFYFFSSSFWFLSRAIRLSFFI